MEDRGGEDTGKGEEMGYYIDLRALDNGTERANLTPHRSTKSKVSFLFHLPQKHQFEKSKQKRYRARST